MIASMQININHCRVWLFYNEMGAVAQCPNNWGVGSAFHPRKYIFIIMSKHFSIKANAKGLDNYIGTLKIISD